MVFADNQKGADEMSHYRHLTIEEREKLYLMKGQGKKDSEIARELGGSRSTIGRELRRNQKGRDAYSPSKAQRYYENRRKNCGRKHILSCPEKREIIRRFIQEEYWSPEQIEKRFQMEAHPVQISFSSIYRAIHAGLFDVNKREAGRSRKKSFAYNLRRKGKKKHKKGDKNRQGQHYRTANRISDRPVEANERSELGHFEADTVVGKRGGACIVSLVDRRSRFTLAAKAPNASAQAVCNTMIDLLTQLPECKVKSITPDCGSEFALYQQVSAAVHNIPFYFADPHSPW